MNLSDDEFTCLMIASEGAPMMPIGRWKPAIEHLVELGFLRKQGHLGDPTGDFNCVITNEGRKACQARDQNDQDAFAASVKRFRQEQVIQEAPAMKEIGSPFLSNAQPKRCPHCGGALD